MRATLTNLERAGHFMVVLLLALVVITGAPEARPQSTEKLDRTPIIWRDPGPIGARDLYWGIGSPDRAPRPPFTFVAEDTAGTKPKVQVKDALGMLWNVKFAGNAPAKNEVHAEIAASRLTWALGYLVEEHYYVASGTIEGVGKLQRVGSAIAPDGAFQVARFERRPAHIVRTNKRWSFDSNPFLGSKELSGLKILATLLNNWDIKHSNTAVFEVPGEDARVEEWHLFSDLGSTFGRMDHHAALISKRSRWSLKDFQEQAFIDRAANGLLDLHYRGAPPIDMVSLEHARWFAGLAGQLTPAQVRRAFEAAGASEAEIEGFSARVMAKIDELQRAVATIEH